MRKPEKQGQILEEKCGKCFLVLFCLGDSIDRQLIGGMYHKLAVMKCDLCGVYSLMHEGTRINVGYKEIPIHRCRQIVYTYGCHDCWNTR